MGIYFSPDYSGKPFEMFGTTHIATLVFFIVSNILLIYGLKKLKSTSMNTCFRIVYGFFIALFDIASIAWFIYTGDFSLSYSLPLHICDVAVILSVLVLLSRTYFLFEVLYFWGLAGTLQAIITPDLYPYDFPHFVFIYYFVLHCAIITTILYMVFIEKYRPTAKSIWRTVLVTNIYAAFIAIVNVLVDGNYMYLCSKPGVSTIMDYLGPWPVYILELELLAIVFFLLYYSPFAIRDYISYKSSKRHIEL